MIIYNVTTKADHAVAIEWLEWLKKEHIPDMTGTGCFTHAIILHLPEAKDAEGITYAVQYHAPDKALYKKYVSEFADEIRKKSVAKWGDRIISFRTLMEVVN